VLQDLTGKPVTAYRAPSFSITLRSLWALEILVQEGFKVDASVFPIRHHRCGIPNAPHHPYVHRTESAGLVEFPASVAHFGQANLPISGGGYFRMFPYRLTSRLLQRVNERLKQPFIFYIHPWELDPSQPRLRVSTRAMRFRHYVNLATTAQKLDRLLTEFSFERVDNVLKDYATHGSADPAVVQLLEGSL
jgi:polysaccharide deacetylase family protein (PEP-CTERM system associated)